MRTTHYLGCILLCLLALGCNGTKWGKGSSTTRGGTNSNEPQDPFMLSSRDGTIAKDPINGILAGYVMDRWRNPLGEVTIEIHDLNDQPAGGKRASISTVTDRAGQYKFEGLNPSHDYKLMARTRDGNRSLVGVVLGKPPNPRLPIFVTEDFSATDPRSAAKDEEGKAPPKERTNAINSPAATLAPPVKNPIEFENPTPAPTPTNSLPTTPLPERGEDRSRSTADEFARNPIVTIPGPSVSVTPTLPPPPRTTPATAAPTVPVIGTPTGPLGATFGRPEGPSPELPTLAVTTPSCTIFGKKVANFSLLDMNGQPWVYTRDRDTRAKVVMLDFWYTTCNPCIQSLPKIRSLNERYGPLGLMTIGITCERGPLAAVTARVNAARQKQGITYTTLLSGLEAEICPVSSQFQISSFPTIILLDENGTIIYRKPGLLDDQAYAELDLFLRRRLSTP